MCVRQEELNERELGKRMKVRERRERKRDGERTEARSNSSNLKCLCGHYGEGQKRVKGKKMEEKEGIVSSLFPKTITPQTTP